MTLFRLLVIDADTLDRWMLRSYLSPRYPDGVELIRIDSRGELDAFLATGQTADAVLLAALPDDIPLQATTMHLLAVLPDAMLVRVVDRYPDAVTGAGVDTSRVALLPAHQLARLPYMLAEWEARKHRQEAMFRETPRIPGADEGLYWAISRLTSDYVYVTEVRPDRTFQVIFRSDSLCDMTGYSHEEINGFGVVGLVHPDDREMFLARRASLLRGEPRIYEFRMLTRDGDEIWIRDYARPIMPEGSSVPSMIVGAAQDITDEKLLQTRLAVQASILEMIARGEPTREVLKALNAVIEEQIPGSHCSIQMVDESSSTLYPEVATSLPPEFLDAIWTIPVSPDHGVCGSAAFYGVLAISVDATEDLRFDRYQDVLSYFGLRAVWSTPIFNPGGNVSGTFALYFRSVREPRDYEISLLESAAQIAGIAMDVDTRDSERQLAQMYYQTLVEQTPAITFTSDPGDPCDITYLSPQFSAFSNVPSAEILRNPEGVREFIHPDDRSKFELTVEQSRENGEPLHADFRIRRLNGETSWLEARVSLLRNHQGMPIHWLGVLLDVTDRNEAIRKMADSERRYRSLFDDNLNSIVMYDYEGRVTDLNPATERMSGYSADELRGNTLLWIIVPDDRALVERYFLEARAGISSQYTMTAISKSGERVELSVSQSPVVVAGEIVGVSSIAEDITERRRLETQLLHQAYNDALTDLPNRVHFERMLSTAMEELGQPCELAILFMDLNNFKVINDSLGHDVGDRFLTTIGRRLRDVVPERANVARFGGDEFTVLLPCESDGIAAASLIAEQIISELATPVMVDGYALGSSVSIGIASMSPASPCQPRELIRRADVALYDAKHGGKESNYGIFNEGMDEWVFERLWIEADLRHAVRNGEFRVYYQPVIDIEHAQVVGLEALVRWEHPERGLLTPDRFLRIAEESGHILEIDQWVMETACRAVADWNARNPDRHSVSASVNMSGRQFWHAGLAEQVSTVLEKTGLPPEFLCIEITESTLMRDAAQAMQVVQQIRDFGVQVAIDDFGTGYSSLSYLRTFPIDVLKIDRTFVSGLDDNEQQRKLVSAIVAMAQALDLVVIAEGVETNLQLESVRMLNCDLAQGYYYSKPRPFAEIEDLLTGQLASTI